MSESSETFAAEVELSDQAVRRLGQIITERQDHGLVLRVYVEGGGCSGFQYGFALASTPHDGDVVVERDGVRMVVDPMSYQYLAGSRVDYREDLMGARFVIENPNAVTTCGCGASFAI